MPATVAAATSGTGESPFAVAVPAGTVNGDLLVAINASDWGTLAQNGLPSGFTALTTATYDGGSNMAHIAVGWRLAASEPASYTFPAGGSSSTVGALLRVTGAAAGPVIVQGTPNPNSPSALSIIPTGADDLLITYHGGEVSAGGTNTWTPPAGMTEHIDAQIDVWTSLGVFSLSPCPNPSGNRAAGHTFASLDHGASCAITIASGSSGGGASGGSATAVSVTTTGGGQKAARAGSGVAVAASVSGGGSKAATGGAGVSVAAVASGGGFKTATGGIGAELSVHATGGGFKSAAGGSAAVVNVSTTGGGERNGVTMADRDITILSTTEPVSRWTVGDMASKWGTTEPAVDPLATTEPAAKWATTEPGV